MLNLYIVRHGQTVFNAEQKLQGWIDSPLTEKGIKDAKNLGKKLKNIEFDRIYSSTSERAIKTAELLTEKSRNEIIAVDNFKEIGVGIWEGKTKEELSIIYPEEWKMFASVPEDFKVEGSETLQEIRNRGFEKINKIIEEFKDRDANVLIIAHGVFIQTILTTIEGREKERFWDVPNVSHTGLSIVEVNGDEKRIKLFGDVSHISEN